MFAPAQSPPSPRRSIDARAADEHGIATVIYALALIPMLGMLALVVDMGVEFARKSQMQAAVDAAVLAAAPALGTLNPLDQVEAVNRAKNLAAANGFSLSDGDIVISTTAAPNDTITINRSQTDDLLFARILGVTTATPSVLARAQIGAVVGGRGIVPFGLEDGPLVYGQTYCLKADANGPCDGIALQGNFRALNVDPGDQGATPYRDDIVAGSSSLLEVGDTVHVAQGNIAGPTRQGLGCDPMPGGGDSRLTGNTQEFEDVFELQPNGMYKVLDWDSPRLALIPIVSYPTPQTALIESFAGFYLDSCDGNGNSASVTGKFVQFIYADADARWAPLGGGTDNGLRTVRLVN